MVYTITNCESVGDKRCSWKQFFLPFVVSLPLITHGIESNNLTITSHSGHFTTHYGVPLSSTMLVLGAGVSAPVLCATVDKLGRKFGIYIIILLQGICCVPLLLPPSDISSVLLHFLAGVSSAGLFTIIPIYILEISPTASRGSFISLMMIMTPIGYLSRLVMSGETMMYVMAALVMVEFVCVFLVIESPSYLVKDKNFEHAKRNIAKLLCVTEDDNYVGSEMMRLKNESERAKPGGKLNLIDIFRNRIWRDAMKIGFMLYSVTVLSGSIIFLDQEKTLAQLKTSLDPENMMVPLCLLAGGITGVVLIRFMERKWHLTFAYSLIVLAMGVLAVFTQADLTVTSLRWLPVTSLGVLVFAYGMSWALPTVIMVEMLNFEVRATVIGIVYTFSQIIRLAHIHTFKYFENLMGLYALFYVFAGINLLGAVYSAVAVPRVKGKSVKQIEKQLRRVPILNL
ncbi:facilitated trehalose transporter Tret1-2 homolog [Zerene cesonia]|uniref:facilitated trehalose transporter Tret1-2 homolog n=1 Tax=Zerene cesonia TaxID=33412 RepID=UPI0018E51FA6|nr:facilitated trehalose transporter Tret1-2 homolog [Zerene cesonia]